MIDPILDELIVNELSERYGHHRLVCVETEELVLPSFRAQMETKLNEFQPLCRLVKSIYPQE